MANRNRPELIFLEETFNKLLKVMCQLPFHQSTIHLSCLQVVAGKERWSGSFNQTKHGTGVALNCVAPVQILSAPVN